MAGGVLTGDGKAAVGPGIADGLERRQQDRVGDGLERARRQHPVEDRLERGRVEGDRGVDEGLEELATAGVARRGPLRWDRRIGRGSGGSRRSAAVEDGCRGDARRPALVHEAAHRFQPLQCAVVVEAIPARRPGRGDDAVAPLPGSKQRNRDARARGGLLDRVHGSSSIHAIRHLTRCVREAKVSTEPRQPRTRCGDRVRANRFQGALSCAISSPSSSSS